MNCPVVVVEQRRSSQKRQLGTNSLPQVSLGVFLKLQVRTGTTALVPGIAPATASPRLRREQVALTYLHAAWAGACQLNAPAVELNILAELAPLVAMYGETGPARAVIQRLQALVATLDLPEADRRPREGFAYQLPAFIAQRERQLEEALALAQQAVALCRDVVDPSMAGDAWRMLGGVQAARGDSASAQQAYTAALAAYEAAGAAVQAQEVRQALAGFSA